MNTTAIARASSDAQALPADLLATLATVRPSFTLSDGAISTWCIGDLLEPAICVWLADTAEALVSWDGLSTWTGASGPEDAVQRVCVTRQILAIPWARGWTSTPEPPPVLQRR